ncbi:MAG: AbrB family transcriptional regulator [Pseudomonadota bacterium]
MFGLGRAVRPDGYIQIVFMCYAPGGVVEMGLIALSLGVSPVLVTLHHFIRIGLTVVIDVGAASPDGSRRHAHQRSSQTGGHRAR